MKNDRNDSSALLLAYRALGVERSASDEALKQRRRDLARVWHPDRFGDDPRMRARAEEELKTINVAFDLVTAERSRHGRSLGDGWRCPDCAGGVTKGDWCCPTCGRRLTFEEDRLPVDASTGWRCPDCGRAVRKGSWRCGECGRRLKFGA